MKAADVIRQCVDKVPVRWCREPSSNPLIVNDVFRVAFDLSERFPTLYAAMLETSAVEPPKPLFIVVDKSNVFPAAPWWGGTTSHVWFDTPEAAVAHWELTR